MKLTKGQSLTIVLTTGADINTSVSWRVDGQPSVGGTVNQNFTALTTGTELMAGRSDMSQPRTVETLSIRNVDTTSNVVTVKLSDGTTTSELYKTTLLAGGQLMYEAGAGWSLPATAPSGYTLLTTTADVANAHATPDTLADITGLTYAVTAGDSYQFRAVIPYTSAATTTGARFTINGPAMTSINFVSRWTLTATTEYFFYSSALLGGTVQASSLAAGNVAVITGHCKPSADGTLAVQFSSEVTVSAITALAGSTFEITKVIDA